MKWSDFIPPVLQRKSRKINHMITAFLLGQPVWTDADFENMAKEGFNKNVWVYRCVMEIAKAGSNIPLILYRRNRNGDLKEIEQHELLELLQRPNKHMSQQEFMENVIAFSQLAGNSYIHLNGANGKPPRELWTLRPDRMKVIPDKNDLIRGYQYEVNGKTANLGRKEVSHIKLFNALDDYYGMSPIQVGARSIDLDNFSNDWNASLLQNGARPSGAMVTEGTLGDSEYNRLQKAIDEKYAGSKNAGKPMLLEGGLDWKEMSLSPQEMDYIETKSMTRLEICSAFGVPPEIVGDHEHATYSNYQEARKGFYQDTVIPVINKVLDVMNADLVPMYDDRLFLAIDRSKIDALQEDRDKVYDRAIKAVEAGLLEVNEGREHMGYEAIEGGNVRFIPQGKIPVGEDAPDITDLFALDSNIDDDSDNDSDDNEGDEDDQKKQYKMRNMLNLQTKIEKKRYWRSFDRRRRAYYGSVGKQIAKEFKKEQKGVLNAFDKYGEKGAMDFLNKNQKEWKKTFKAIYIAVMDEFGSTVFNSLVDGQKSEMKDERPKFDVYDDAVQRFIGSVIADKVVNINRTTRMKIKAIVQAGFDEDLTMPEIRDGIENLYLEQIIPNRSMVIARTEVIGASNAGSRYAAKQTGLELKKEWVATADSRTRDSHEEADGQIRSIDEPYNVGDSELMFPGDPDGEPEDVIQCRCAEVYITE